MHEAPPLHGLHDPALQTPPGHEVPLPLLLPSMHTALPVAQSMVPLRHVELGFEVQPAPCVQALQKPALHTPPAHVVPFALAVPSMHTALPVVQLMVPLRHAAFGLVVQLAPALQATQAPALHTPLGHVVPFILLLPSTHTALPDAQLMRPLRQAAPGLVVHDAPSLHAMHEPALQTPPLQTVPFVFGAPSTQTGAPLEHSMVPARQAEAGFVAHEAPCVHETHWSRALQTWFVPHVAPVPLREPFAQTGEPEVQAMEPLKHGFVGVQALPAAQFTHAPALSQT